MQRVWSITFAHCTGLSRAGCSLIMTFGVLQSAAKDLATAGKDAWFPFGRLRPRASCGPASAKYITQSRQARKRRSKPWRVYPNVNAANLHGHDTNPGNEPNSESR